MAGILTDAPPVMGKLDFIERKNSSISVQAAGRNQGTERSEILKLAEVVSSVSPCPLIVYQREPRGDQHVSE